MIAMIRENITEIMIYGFMFLVGFGIGSTITDTVNRGMSHERDNKTKHDGISTAEAIRQMRFESEREGSTNSCPGEENEYQDKGQQP